MKNNYLLTESLISSISVYLIIKKLMTDFVDWDAYKLGIIDKDGKKLKHPVTAKEIQAWDILTRLCWNLKKTATKFIGKSKFATYFCAAYLLKDSITMTYIDKNRDILNETLLADITYSKQSLLNEIIKTLPTITERVTENNIELLMFKYLQVVENVLILKDVSILYEDDAPAPTSNPTVAGDIAQRDQYLGLTKRKSKRKKGKRNPYENK